MVGSDCFFVLCENEFTHFELNKFTFLLTRTQGHILTLHSLANESYDYERKNKVKNRRVLTDDASDS